MTRAIVFSLAAGFLVAIPARAQSAGSPLCEIGSSVVDLMYLQSTGANARIDPAILRASIVFLKECPASVIPAFGQFGVRGPWPDLDHVSALRHAWIEAARSAALDSSNTDVRGLLAAAQVSIARLGDHSLNEYLDGIFEGVADTQGVDQRFLEPLFERQALASLRDWAKCDGVGCFDASDILVFLLGTHPNALLKAIRADSVDGTKWLLLVGDESFAGAPDRGESREAARRAVLRKLSEVRASGFERELRACQNRLRDIRYRPVR